MTINRRQLFSGLGSAALLSMLPRGILAAEPQERAALVVIHLRGGYNALFSSASGLIGNEFGVTRNNVADFGNGVVVDRIFDGFSSFTKNHMATIGINHGISGHFIGRSANYDFEGINPLLMIGAGLGGNAPIKAANLGPNGFFGSTKSFHDVTLQNVTDMETALETLGSIPPSENSPNRALAMAGLEMAKGNSQARFQQNPESLKQQLEGLDAGIATLSTTQNAIELAAVKAAYGVASPKIANRDFAAQMAAAELMIRAGTNVISVSENRNWDTHGDRDGMRARELMRGIFPALKTFTNRMLQAQNLNVVVVLTGEFARSVPGSNHANCTAATVMGRYVQGGTTGEINANVTLKSMGIKRDYPQFWGFVSAALHAEQLVKTFGGNPHRLVV